LLVVFKRVFERFLYFYFTWVPHKIWLEKKNVAKLSTKFGGEDYDKMRGHHGHDRMVDGFTTTYAISAHHH
jgi:hypothetical protein